MCQVVGPLPLACAAARAAGRAPAEVNPVLRDAIGADPVIQAQVLGLAPPERELLVRHVTAPVALVLATESADGAARIRLGLHPGRPTAQTARGEQACWADEPRLLESLTRQLPRDPVFRAAPRLTQESAGARLALTPAQRARVARALAGGAGSAACAGLEDLDALLRDALLATGPRVLLTLCLRGVRGGPAPLLWTRLWAVGERGLYRITPDPLDHASVLPVVPGDVRGSLQAVLEHGLRLAAALPASAAGGR